MTISFDNLELQRYARHLILPEFNINGQRKLKKSSVLIVGAGGLGSPILLYLAAAGVGTIGIIDYDTVDVSNLQRQILYNSDDINLKKSEIARAKLIKLNPYINCKSYDAPLANDNALNIFNDYDLIIDGTDNFPTRYLINDACVLLNKPFIYGSIFQFEGQVCIFNNFLENGEKSACYRCLYPAPPPKNLVPNCQEGGILGVLPGIIGSIQANEAIKVLTSIGNSLTGRLFIFDAFSCTTRTINIEKDISCSICSASPTITKLQDYDFFCSKEDINNSHHVKEVTVSELKRRIDTGYDFQLIDVREPFEIEIASIGGNFVPLSDINRNNKLFIDKIAVNKDVIFYCRDGSRSKAAILLLEKEYGLANLYNLRGGILEWALQIDDSIPYY